MCPPPQRTTLSGARSRRSSAVAPLQQVLQRLLLPPAAARMGRPAVHLLECVPWRPSSRGCGGCSCRQQQQRMGRPAVSLLTCLPHGQCIKPKSSMPPARSCAPAHTNVHSSQPQKIKYLSSVVYLPQTHIICGCCGQMYSTPMQP